jgi:hypothetical protein
MHLARSRAGALTRLATRDRRAFSAGYGAATPGSDTGAFRDLDATLGGMLRNLKAKIAADCMFIFRLDTT